ncbi:MAG: RlmE family RNA methyltransferase [Deltaproteobacteria bacterium]
MPYEKKDRFHQRAKRENFAARSVYKLEEIDRRLSLFDKGARIVDLGASPGSWMQYISRVIGKKGVVAGYDLEPAEVVPGPNASHEIASVDDLTPERVRRQIAELVAKKKGTEVTEEPPPTFRIDGLVSDMAPKLTGIRDADQAKSVALARQALLLSDVLVKEGGFFIAKLFQGRDADELIDEAKRIYKDVKLLKPEATREGSREVFLIGRHKKTAPRSSF